MVVEAGERARTSRCAGNRHSGMGRSGCVIAPKMVYVFSGRFMT